MRDVAAVPARDLADRARPTPRPAARRALVVQPRSRTCARLVGGQAGAAVARPRRATAPSASPPSATATRRSLAPADGVEGVVDEVAEDGDQVARPRTGRRRASSPAMRRARCRARRPRPSCRAAAPRATGSPTAPTTWSVEQLGDLRAPRSRSSTASSARPISISETTVCSRLAASWFCERSDSVRPRTTSSSPVTDRSSVWSRRVTTAPTSRPPRWRAPS